MEIALIKGDITTLSVDAIVNAANTGLRGGGGVDGAIHRAGGPSIMQECREIINRHGKLEPGEAVITGAGDLPCQFVIHAVGPIYDASRAAAMKQLLRKCYLNALELADVHELSSIAFPNISTGVYGFPKWEAAEVATEAVRSYVSGPTGLSKICYVCFDRENQAIYSELLK